ncbi:MAG: GspMb/PilO family protein [Bryobacter sp.]|nr:GspMb/PilO family protein [Bryobacter sp.]
MNFGQISDREKRLLLALGAMLVVWVVFQFVPEESGAVVPVAASAANTVEGAQKKLRLARASAAQLPARQEEAKKFGEAAKALEKRFLQAETAPQVTANLNNLIRRVAKGQGEGVTVQSTDLGTVRAAGGSGAAAYGEAAVNVGLNCQIEGLVNFLSELTTQPELVAWRDLRIVSGDAKTKRLQVQVVVAARVPAALVPKAGAGLPGGVR